MKKFLVLLAAMVIAAVPAAAQLGPPSGGDVSWQTRAVFTSTGTSTTVGTAQQIQAATGCLVTLTSTSTSSATLSVEGSQDGVTYWTALATASNPAAATPAVYAGPCMPYMRFNPSAHASGTLKGYLSYRTMPSDPIGHEWKLLTQPTVSFGAGSFTSVTDSGLTTTRVPFATTGGLLTDSSAFTFTTGTGTLAATKFSGAFDGGSVTSSTLTSGRIPFVGASGLISDVGNFTYNSTTGAITNTNGTAPSISTQRFLSTGTAPGVANVGSNSCGTSAATIAGKDQAHVITVGATSGTDCRVTFNVAFANAPVCTVTGETATDLHVVTTTTTSTITGTLTAGEKIYEICLGY